MKMNKKKARNQSAGDRINSAVDDVKSGYKDFKENTLQSVSDAKDNAVTWVEEGVSNLKEGTHHLLDDTKEAIVKTAQSIDKNVKHGLSQYNAKAQELADKVPGGLGDKVIRYPWVAISISLLIGIGLGFLLKPRRRA
jgi:vacuolar-type H+-ATPase subunit H